MSHLRAPLAGLVAVVLAVGLTACGGGGSSSTPSSSSTGAALPAPRQVSPHPPHSAGPSGSTEPGKASTQAPTHPGGAPGPVVPSGAGSIGAYGSEASAGERRSAEANLSSYFTALSSRDWPTACRHLAASTQIKLEQFAKGKPLDGCPGALETLIGQAPPFALKNSLAHGLLSLRVKGEKGFALWRGPHGRISLIPMAGEGGSWRPAEIAALSYGAGGAPPG